METPTWAAVNTHDVESIKGFKLCIFDMCTACGTHASVCQPWDVICADPHLGMAPTMIAMLSVVLILLVTPFATALQCYNNLLDPTNRNPVLSFQSSDGRPYSFCQQFYLQAGPVANVTFVSDLWHALALSTSRWNGSSGQAKGTSAPH